MTDNEKLTLWLGAFRYYLGRETYAVSEFCDLLIRMWGSLPDVTKDLIKRDLDRAFESERELTRSDSGNYRPLGMECDKAQWERVATLWQQEEV